MASDDPLFVPVTDSSDESAGNTRMSGKSSRPNRKGNGGRKRASRRSGSSFDAESESVKESTYFMPSDPQVILRLYKEVDEHRWLNLECKCVGEEERKARRFEEPAPAQAKPSIDSAEEGDDEEDGPKQGVRHYRRHSQQTVERARAPSVMSAEFDFEEDDAAQPVHRAHRGRRKIGKKSGNIDNVLSSLWRSGQMDASLADIDQSQEGSASGKACVKTPAKLHLSSYSFSQASPSPDARMDISSQVTRIANRLDFN